MYCLLQTTVIRCQSHKTKGRPCFQKKTSVSKQGTDHGRVAPRRGQRRRGLECLPKTGLPTLISHAGILTEIKGEMWRFRNILFMCFKSWVTNSFTVDLSYKMAMAKF